MSRSARTACTEDVAKPFYEAAGYCVEESVGWLMKRALLSIAQAADRRLEPKGITHAQWAALFMLARCRASTVAELARETYSDPGAMTRLLDRLEAKGFCRRQRSTDDRRVVRIELTAEGEVAAQEVPIVLSEVLNEHLAGFSNAEWSQMKDMLKRMVANGCAVEKGNGS
ncbi:MAG: MarR family transcriptional regulator [Caldimonas sp.]